jgi:hypothetical protein
VLDSAAWSASIGAASVDRTPAVALQHDAGFAPAQRAAHRTADGVWGASATRRSSALVELPQAPKIGIV